MTDPAEPGRHVGRPTPRIEDARLVTGDTRWTDSVAAPGALHLAVLRSPMAHARIVRCDVSAARDQAGVAAAFSGDDLADTWASSLPASAPRGGHVPDHWPLTRDKVRYVGDAVAVVLAEDRYKAVDALELVDVDYDPLPAVVGVEAALADKTLVHDEAGTNAAYRFEGRPSGDVDAAFATVDVVVERRYTNQRVVPVAMEPRAALAVPEPDGHLTLYTSTQVPHSVRRDLAAVLGLDEAAVRVVAPDVGGGFGSKLNLYAEDALCAALALRLGRPVRYTATRSEDIVATNHGRAQVQEVAVAARGDGTLLGLRVHIYPDMGGYLLGGTAYTPLSGRRMYPGCYRFEAYRFDATGVFTTTTPTDAYRGAGRPEATFAVERALDDLAAHLGVDPADLRRRNFPAPEEFPFASIGGYTYDSGRYADALDAALEAVGYDEVRAEQARCREDGEKVLLGVGLSSYVEVCGFGPGDPEAGGVRIDAEGRVTVTTGLSPHGQGTATSLAQLAADALGVDPADVLVVHGDTSTVPVGSGTYGSRSMPVGALAVRAAAREVVDKARAIAAHLLEAATGDVVADAGRFVVRGSPDAAVTLAEVARAAHDGDLPDGVEPGLEASVSYEPDGLTFPFGAHACVVEVDTETGAVAVRRYVAVDDCGELINPLLVDGQRHGGIAQGIAQALYEEATYDADGNPLAGTLVDYLVPGAPDLPSFDLRRQVTPTDANPLGVKGVGEAGAIGATPAVANAVVDALRHLGVDDVAMPCTPQRVWRALQPR